MGREVKATTQKRTRTFQFVMFWDEVAWVAGTVEYYYVAQGRDLADCYDNLLMGMQATAWWNGEDGNEPFKEPNMQVPPEVFTRVDDCCTFDPTFAGDPEKRYTGSLTIEWDQVVKPPQPDPQRKRRR